jgi:RNA polymerase sigma factor (sigma-70 family)
VKTHDAEELWRRFGAGDGSAFTQLYSDHHHDVVRYCRSLLRDDEDAQDAAQGAWAAIWDKPDAARRDIPLRPWLFRVAHNESINIIRRRRSHDTLADLDLPALDDVANDVERRDRLATLRVDLVNLPERQRVALLSRELGGLGHAEIGAALGISAAAAKQTIYEARRALIEAESGRSMACALVERAISDGDGRVRRSRRLSAHLRDCAGCRAFAETLGRRRRDLRLLFPAPAGLGLLGRAAAGAGAGGAAGGGLAAGGGGALAAKMAVAAAAVAVAGAGGYHALGMPGGAEAKGSSATRAAAVVRARVRTSAPTGRSVVVRAVAPSRPVRRRPASGVSSATRVPARRPRLVTHHRPSAGPVAAAKPVAAPPVTAPSAPAGAALPPGQAKKADGALPPGQAKKADGALPPGQAKKADGALPPGQAKKTDGALPPGQTKKTGAAAAPAPAVPVPAPADMPPGQAKKIARGEQSTP